MLIKVLLEKYKARFESYGEESTRDTFKGELNYDSGKLFYMFFLAFFAWLPYIPYDLQIHQYPAFAVGIRISFTLISAVLILLKFTKRFRHRPDILLMALVISLYFLTAVVTGTSGRYAPGYVGGLSFVLLLPVFVPFPAKVKYSLPVLAITVFFVAGTLTGLDFSDLSVLYSFNDLFVSFIISMVLSYTLSDSRYRSWEQRQKLKEVIENNEKNLATISKLADEAAAATRSKSDFLAKMSHEIRTPMNAITGMAELALREELTPAAYEHLLTIKQAGTNLISIINDILDFSKIESGKLEIVPGDYLLPSLLNDVISIIRMRVIDSPVCFVVNIDCNMPSSLYGDEIRIRQVLLNILSNAVKYTEAGYVSFTVTGDINGDMVDLIVEVADSGKGMKQADLEKLFGDFVQFDLASNKGIEGTGLGLAITHNLVKAMAGDITVSSEYGRGSTFIITLPQKILGHDKLATVENPAEKRVLVYELRDMYADSIVCTIDNLGVSCTLVATAAELEAEIGSGVYSFVFIASTEYEKAAKICYDAGTDAMIVMLAGFGEAVAGHNVRVLSMPVHSISVANILNGVADEFSYGDSGEFLTLFTIPDSAVLIVDDINTNLNVAQGLLLPYQAEVTLLKSGPEAIAAITAKRYDLVFMDHMMPEMDGIEATARIRAINPEDPYYQQVPIVALTANAVSGTKEMFLANGFNDFLSKPIDTIKLNAILEKWIPKAKQMKSKAENAAGKSQPEDAAATAEMEIAGIDVKKGIKMSGGSIANYKRILGIFKRDGHLKLEEIKSCLETDNLPLYVTHVHALKGAGANIGADRLAETAQTLETAGKQEDLVFVHTHTVKLLSALEALLHQIGAALAEDNAAKENGDLDLSALPGFLSQLAAALDSVNPRAIKEAVKNLQPFDHAAGIGETVTSILQNTLVGEYDEAAALISSLIGENGSLKQ